MDERENHTKTWGFSSCCDNNFHLLHNCIYNQIHCPPRLIKHVQELWTITSASISVFLNGTYIFYQILFLAICYVTDGAYITYRATCSVTSAPGKAIINFKYKLTTSRALRGNYYPVINTHKHSHYLEKYDKLKTCWLNEL